MTPVQPKQNARTTPQFKDETNYSAKKQEIFKAEKSKTSAEKWEWKPKCQRAYRLAQRVLQ